MPVGNFSCRLVGNINQDQMAQRMFSDFVVTLAGVWKTLLTGEAINSAK